MTEPEDARRREDASIRTEQRLLDFIEQYKEDKTASLTWRAKHDKDHASLEDRLKPLEDLTKTLKRPAQIIGAVLLLMATPFLGVLGWKTIAKTLEWLNRMLQNGHP